MQCDVVRHWELSRGEESAPLLWTQLASGFSKRTHVPTSSTALETVPCSGCLDVPASLREIGGVRSRLVYVR